MGSLIWYLGAEFLGLYSNFLCLNLFGGVDLVNYFLGLGTRMEACFLLCYFCGVGVLVLLGRVVGVSFFGFRGGSFGQQWCSIYLCTFVTIYIYIPYKKITKLRMENSKLIGFAKSCLIALKSKWIV